MAFQPDVERSLPQKIQPIKYLADMCGQRAIGDGRRLLRHVLFQVTLVASHHNPVPKL